MVFHFTGEIVQGIISADLFDALRTTFLFRSLITYSVDA